MNNNEVDLSTLLEEKNALLKARTLLDISAADARKYANALYKTFDITGKDIAGSDKYHRLLEAVRQNPQAEPMLEELWERSSEQFVDFCHYFLKMDGQLEQECSSGGNELYFGSLHKLTDKMEVVRTGSSGDTVSIDYPDCSWNQMKEDFDAAPHLRELRTLLNEQGDFPNHYVVISADTHETGVMALHCTAAAVKESLQYELNYMQEQVGLPSFEELFSIDNDDDDDNDAFDFGKSLPCVLMTELLSHYKPSANNALFDFGFCEGSGSTKTPTPYWARKKDCPIAVIINRDVITTEMIEVVERLKTHSVVILLVVPREKRSLNYGTLEAPAKLSDILDEISFVTAVEPICIHEPDADSDFHKRLLCSLTHERGFTLAPSVDCTQIIKLLVRLRGALDITTLRHCVDNAVMRAKQRKELTNEDFAFLRSKSRAEQEADITAMQRLQKNIIGLAGVKKQVMNIIGAMKLAARRRELGMPDAGISNVMAFVGPPGTAKTSVAKLMGEIMVEESLLPSSDFLSVSGAQLKAKYLGQTAWMVSEMFSKNSVIFIDEAYSLVSEGQDSFAKEALAQLCIELESHASDRLVIFAGYGGDVSEKNNRMREFFESNPGIASRINFTVNFDRYDPDSELVPILSGLAQQRGLVLEPNALNLAREYFVKRSGSESFGNGREARRLLEHALISQTARLSGNDHPTIDQLGNLTEQDFRQAAEELETSLTKGAGVKQIGFIRSATI